MKEFNKRQEEAYSIIKKDFDIDNPMLLPKINKISLNMGLANFSGDNKKIAAAVEELSLIASQKPVITYAKKSIAGFNLREDQAVGCKVTLRRDRMKSFFDRLVIIALPRVRDFKGFKESSIDNNNGFSIGINEHIIFPELDYDKIESIKGMNINIDVTSNHRDITKNFLHLMGIPFNN